MKINDSKCVFEGRDHVYHRRKEQRTNNWTNAQRKWLMMEEQMRQEETLQLMISNKKKRAQLFYQGPKFCFYFLILAYKTIYYFLLSKEASNERLVDQIQDLQFQRNRKDQYFKLSSTWVSLRGICNTFHSYIILDVLVGSLSLLAPQGCSYPKLT